MKVQFWHWDTNHWDGERRRMGEYLGGEGMEATDMEEREEVAGWKCFFFFFFR